LLTAFIFAGAAGLITKFAMTPIYSSTAQLYVVSKGGLSQLTDLTMGTQLTQDYMVIVKTRPVLDKVIEDLHLDMDYKELGDKITVENPSDTRIMQITVTDKDSEVAREITQDLAEVTSKTVAKKMDVKSPTIIEKAYKAEQPDSPSLKKNIVIGALLGFILMAAKYHIQGIDKGLSHYLTGQAEIEDIIYETEVDGFYLAVAGPLTPDPTTLLDSDAFKQFISKAREDFDYVIIDAPPLGVVIDAVIIGKYSDGALLVIEQGVIKRKVVQDVIKQLKKGEVRILGAVLNKVDERIGAYGNYEYKYSYSYYGESDTSDKN